MKDLGIENKMKSRGGQKKINLHLPPERDEEPEPARQDKRQER